MENNNYSNFEIVVPQKKEEKEDMRCPFCESNKYTIDYSIGTLTYCPPIIVDGKNINKDKNIVTEHCNCLDCGKRFYIKRMGDHCEVCK